MTWEVEYTDEFGTWWNSLNEAEQVIHVPIADRLYDDNLKELEDEARKHGKTV